MVDIGYQVCRIHLKWLIHVFKAIKETSHLFYEIASGLDGCRPGWLDVVAFDGIDGASKLTDPAVPPGTESGFG